MSVSHSDPTTRKLSVIIPCYNGAQTIGAQLEALARQQWPGPWEVIIADNGSTDDTLAIVNGYAHRLPNLRVVDASARRGQPYALNAGIQAATGDALLFCDADDEVKEGWLAAMAEALSQHNFVACRIDARKLNPSWLAQGRGSSQDDRLHTLSFAPHLFFAGGGTLGVRRSVLISAAGGFDESLPAQHDTMLCIQLQMAGEKLHFVPEAVLHIRYRETLKDNFRQAYIWGMYVPPLYKKSVALGVPEIPHPWKKAIREWRSVLGMLRRARTKAALTNSLFRLGWKLGLLRGSLKHRVVYL